MIFFLEVPVLANWFSMNNKQTPTPSPSIADEIQVLDSIDRLILRRQKEAQKLIEEGKKLIEKGEKKNSQKIIVKGKIKKEIGEKQLFLLREQAENKKKESQRDEW